LQHRSLSSIALALKLLELRREAQPTIPAEPSTLPFAVIQGWVVGIGALVTALALRGVVEDTAGPAWSVGAILSVSALVGALAVGSLRQPYVYASGLLINLAGPARWLAWYPQS